MRAATHEEQALAHFIGLLFLCMGLRQVEGHSLGLRCNPGDQAFHVLLFVLAKRRSGNFFGIEALLLFHAGQEARLQILHLCGVCKIAG
ncbi:hypothetical protein D3C71_1855330 [compost metagenome]